MIVCLARFPVEVTGSSAGVASLRQVVLRKPLRILLFASAVQHYYDNLAWFFVRAGGPPRFLSLFCAGFLVHPQSRAGRLPLLGL